MRSRPDPRPERDHFLPLYVDGELVALVRMGTGPSTALTPKRMTGVDRAFPTATFGKSAPLPAVARRRFPLRQEPKL